VQENRKDSKVDDTGMSEVAIGRRVNFLYFTGKSKEKAMCYNTRSLNADSRGSSSRAAMLTHFIKLK
jgi:hypothetical protein